MGRVGAIAGLALLLGGCAGQPIVYYRAYTSYHSGEFAYAGSLPLDVYGNASKGSQEDFNSALAEMMSGGLWGTEISVVTKRPPESHTPYRLVLFFDPPWSASFYRLCGDPSMLLPVAPDPGSRKLSAVLCRADYPIAGVYAGLGSDGLEDPSFRRAIQLVELQMLVPQNREIHPKHRSR